MDLRKSSKSCMSANIVGSCSLLVRITSSHTRLTANSRFSVVIHFCCGSEDFCRAPCEALIASISFCCLATVDLRSEISDFYDVISDWREDMILS